MMTSGNLCNPQTGDDSLEQSFDEGSGNDQSSGDASDGGEPVSASSSGLSPDTQSASTDEVETPEVMDSRAYQLEMLNKSLEGNVIVAVCQVAVLVVGLC